MMYVVAYDIKEDDIRARMATVLGGFGQRVQESVFECPVRPGDLPLLMDRLREVLGTAEAGNVRLYRICADCRRHSFGLGELRKPLGGDGAIIL